MDVRIVSTGQMAAQSISIQLTNRERCNAGCLFCISRTMPGSKNNKEIIRCEDDDLAKGLNYAKYLGATHAILTGKADPTQEDRDYLCFLIRESRKYLPLVDMHTNGYYLQDEGCRDGFLLLLKNAGLTNITFSIASFNKKDNWELMRIKQDTEQLIKKAVGLGLLVRCSLVVNKYGVADFEAVMDYIKTAGELGAHMVVVRQVWVPDVYADHNEKVIEWNRNYAIPIKRIQDEFIEAAKDRKNKYGLQQRDPLPWGTPVFAVGGIFKDKNHGVNVTFALCDEASSGPVMKSIVHKPDGHGYRNWDHNGDILY